MRKGSALKALECVNAKGISRMTELLVVDNQRAINLSCKHIYMNMASNASESTGKMVGTEGDKCVKWRVSPLDKQVG